MLRYLAVLTFLALWTTSVFAQDFEADLGGDGGGANSFNLPVYVDVFGSWGYAQAKGTTATAEPSMSAFMGGGSIAAIFSQTFILGATADYRFYGQLDGASPDTGNLRGSRWTIAPVVGIRYGKFLLKFDYQFFGDYTLDSRDQTGDLVVYKNPTGFRGSLLYQLFFDRFFVGLQYETIDFTQRQVGATVEELTPSFNMWQAGLILNYVI